MELKSGDEVMAILRSNPVLGNDEETGEHSFDQECFKPDSFKLEMVKMAEISLFLNQAYIQLVHRYPNVCSNL